MQLFVDETAQKRAGAREILNSLPGDFPGVQEARSALERGQYPVEILRRSWESFARKLETLRSQMEYQASENADLRKLVASYRADPCEKKLESAQAALQESNARAASGEAMNVQLRAVIDAEQRKSRMVEHENERLLNVIADYKRVVAEQHKKLVSLLGDE